MKKKSSLYVNKAHVVGYLHFEFSRFRSKIDLTIARNFSSMFKKISAD